MKSTIKNAIDYIFKVIFITNNYTKESKYVLYR